MIVPPIGKLKGLTSNFQRIAVGKGDGRRRNSRAPNKDAIGKGPVGDGQLSPCVFMGDVG